MSANERATAGITFTPRRSHRCNKLEMSLKEEDLRKSLNNSTIIQHTPGRLRRLLNPERSVLHCPLDSPAKGPASDEKTKNSKRRNKKSKKQKTKANLKRKDAKQFKTHRSGSDESQETSGVECETAESDMGASSKESNLTDSKTEASEQAVGVVAEELKEDSLCVEKKVENVESGFESSKTKEALLSMQSPDLSANKNDDVINLVTPDLNGVNQPEKVVESSPEESRVDAKDKSEERSKEETKDGTYELSESTIPVSELKHEAAKVETPKEVASVASRCGPRFSSTPARKSVNNRKGTPFKPVKEDSLRKVIVANVSPNRVKAAGALMASPIVTPITGKSFAKTPLKSAMRRSRRSYSCDAAILNTTTKRAVIFHSPLNTTILIDEVDLLMKSKKKTDTKTEEAPASDHVTMRRKRSLSVAETESEKDFVKSLQPSNEGVLSGKKTSRIPTPSSRVKLPNFAAIHKQQFEKMESISDHVARKNERLKVLSGSKSKQDLNTSATKVGQAGVTSGKDGVSIRKDDLNRSMKKDVKRLNAAAKSINKQPKARQRIELASINVNKKSTVEAVKSVLQENKNIINKSTRTAAMKGLKKASKDAPKTGENIIDRQKEHMSMFKNNSFANATILQDERKERKDYIAGVRSNRRFMLQMQHRDRVYK